MSFSPTFSVPPQVTTWKIPNPDQVFLIGPEYFIIFYE